MDSPDTVATEQCGSIPVRHRDCPLCSRNNDRAAASGYSHGPWAVIQCPDCGFVYIENAPRYDVKFDRECLIKVEQQRHAELRPLLPARRMRLPTCSACSMKRWAFASCLIQRPASRSM